jgi:hypothetical protein
MYVDTNEKFQHFQTYLKGSRKKSKRIKENDSFFIFQFFQFCDVA